MKYLFIKNNRYRKLTSWVVAGALLIASFSGLSHTANAAVTVNIDNPTAVADTNLCSGQNVTWNCVYYGAYPQAEVVGDFTVTFTPDPTATPTSSAATPTPSSATPSAPAKTPTPSSATPSAPAEAPTPTPAQPSDTPTSSAAAPGSETFSLRRQAMDSSITQRISRTSISELLKEEGDVITDSALLQQLVDSTSWDSHNNLVIDGKKYHRIKYQDTMLSQCDPNYLGESSAYYPWDEEDEYYRYFLYQPIKWRVLQIENSKVLLLADKALDVQMDLSLLDLPDQNEVFRLTEQDLTTAEYGFAAKSTIYDEARRSKSTVYAKAMGVHSSINQETDRNGKIICDAKNCSWYMAGDSVCVDYYGEAANSVNARHIYPCVAERPAIYFDKESESDLYYAGTVNSYQQSEEYAYGLFKVKLPAVVQTATPTTDASVQTDSPLPSASTEPGENESPLPSASTNPSESTSPNPSESTQPGESTSPNPSASTQPGESTSPNPSASTEPGESTSPNPSASTQPGESTSPNPSASTEPGESISPSPGASTQPGESTSPSPGASTEPGESTSPNPSASTEPGESISPSPSASAEPEESISPSPSASAEPIESEDPDPIESEDPDPIESEDPDPMESENPEPTETDSPQITTKPTSTPVTTKKPNTSSNSSSVKVGKCFNDSTSFGRYKITKTGTNGTVLYLRSTKKKLTNVKIPSTVMYNGQKFRVTGVGEHAFYKNKNIKKVTFGKYVVKISNRAFYKCTKLKTVVFNSNLVSIGTKSFYKCTALTKVTFPSKLQVIGSMAFYSCKKLEINATKVKMSMVTVGNKALKGIKKIKKKKKK